MAQDGSQHLSAARGCCSAQENAPWLYTESSSHINYRAGEAIATLSQPHCKLLHYGYAARWQVI